MKRRIKKQREDYHATYGDPKSDFTPAQLKWIGAIAMNFNEAEALIETAFFHATQLPDAIRLDVSTRINGIDGKIEIVQSGASTLGLDTKTCGDLAASLGDGGFKLIKGYRDAIIHSRAHNSPKGIGIRVDRRAKVYEVLLTETALKTLYEHISALRIELSEINQLLLYASQLSSMSDAQGKGQLAALISVATTQLRSHRSWRLSLQQLPKFPSEQELLEARETWHQAQIEVQQKMLEAIFGDPANSAKRSNRK